MIVNKKAFDALDAGTKDAVRQASAKIEAKGWEESRAVMSNSLNTLKSNGMTIHQPPAALKADMQKVGDTLLKEWLAKAGPEGQSLIDAYRKP